MQCSHVISQYKAFGQDDLKLFSAYEGVEAEFVPSNKHHGCLILIHFKDSLSVDKVMAGKEKVVICSCRFQISKYKVNSKMLSVKVH